MTFQVILSPDAVADIDEAFEHYNKVVSGLGVEFVNTLDRYIEKISRLPTASAIRYDQVRVKPIDTFPFAIHFTVSNKNQVIILRIFNTHQKPLR